MSTRKLELEEERKRVAPLGRSGALHLLGQSDEVSTGGNFPVIRARK